MTCHAVNPLDAAVCSSCGAAFLAAAGNRPSLVLPVVGDLSRLSRAERLWGAVALVFVLLVVVGLLSLLTAGSAPPATPKQAPATPSVVQPSDSVIETPAPSTLPTDTATP